MTIKQSEDPGLPATNVGPKPGDFPIGSIESRAAARAQLDRARYTERQVDVVVILSGLGLRDCRPAITPPDSLEYYQAPDSSIVQVVYRNWWGQDQDGVTAFITQVKADGEAYRGDCLIESLEEAQRLPRVEQAGIEKLWPGCRINYS